jgi:hypothetical protein
MNGFTGRRRAGDKQRESMPIGTTAAGDDITVRSFQVGSLPLLNHFLQRLELEDILGRYLPADDVRQELPTERIVFRLIWFHAERKAELDRAARGQRVQRAIKELEALQRRLQSPRTRFRDFSRVQQACDAILSERGVEGLLQVDIEETQEASCRQQRRGRPSANTEYRRETRSRFTLSWRIDERAWRHHGLDDGVFLLLTNDRALRPREVLEAYKRQPKIENRFGQLKSDYDIAPVFLKSPERVLGLFTVYFLPLLVQSLLERELRNALQDAAARDAGKSKKDRQAIAIYPEGRRTRRPTARRVIDALEPLRRHEIHGNQARVQEEPTQLFDTLNETQMRLLQLF